MANTKCKECGCVCKKCTLNDHDVHLHVEIENLKQKLFEKENHIVTMETNFLNEANKFPNGEMVALREELLTWQDKYKRLYEAHRRVQRVNQGLEDKLLKLVDVCETDKSTLTKDVATLSHKLADANYTIKKLTEDNERYKKDVLLAIQFLQCKQSNFVAHKFDSLPQEVQSQVASHMTNKRKPEEKKSPPEIKSIKVPIPTFPPTAMVYSIPKSPSLSQDRPQFSNNATDSDAESTTVDIVSAAIMAKVLEERQKERALAKHCDTCTCSKSFKIVYDSTHHTVGTQTGEYKEMVCLRCNESFSTTSGIKLLSLEKAAKVPTFPDLDSNNTTNVVKVQPNNFLVEKSKSNSSASSLIDLSTPQHSVPTPKSINSNIHVIGSELNISPDITFKNVNGNAPLKEHHRLCNKSSPKYEIPVEKSADSEGLASAKNISSSTNNNNLRGPRYCSMLVQSGSKNILLDNAHNNVAPVLYTRSHKIRPEDKAQTLPGSKDDSAASSMNNISISSDNSVQNQQRVAEWIQNNIDNDNSISSSDHSRSDSVRGVQNNVESGPLIDKDKYKAMEENVKRFLFGESEFLKTVELGKQRYQNYSRNELSNNNESDLSEVSESLMKL